MLYSRSSYSSLPQKAGVYVFLGKPERHSGKPKAHPESQNARQDDVRPARPSGGDSGQARMTDNVLYVGKANDLRARVSSYFTNSSLLGNKTRVLVSHIENIRITEVESELEALLLEAFYIKKYKPKYNIRLTDNKQYIRIRITEKDVYPKVLLARREEDPSSVYFGPYPSSRSVKLVLKTIRRVFPYQSVPNHPKRICLYNHLGLCPCPPVNDSQELRSMYKKNIKGIIRILEGESQKIQKELEKERDKASKEEEFEKALLIQKKINALSLITTPFHRPFEYHVNPNLRDDLRQQELEGLRSILNEHGFSLEELERIECYDISNTQGTHATGSMVVFINGEKDSSQYRKFRIRRDWEKPKSKAEKIAIAPNPSTSLRANRHLANDFAMMREVLKRRLSHEEWQMPSLIIVDGGKGQVSSAVTTLAECKMDIPLIGLAKREETIIVPNVLADGINEGTSQSVKTYSDLLNLRFAGTEKEKNQIIVVAEENFTEISLPKNSASSQLIQRIRNEAHRFAITYHRKLRSKSQLNQTKEV